MFSFRSDSTVIQHGTIVTQVWLQFVILTGLSAFIQGHWHFTYNYRLITRSLSRVTDHKISLESDRPQDLLRVTGHKIS